ncbi:NADPH-dependent FMN reductase [Actinomadura opuntiae]|uniref:NADPH-dependent FMN reductase n=1 Tax=Actinomadura sp. OS1-43 TaxID=604315 RepID=UPI00255ABD12|nr:NAD(P)H-dependent oxidoreductase [Actinomadura sp. OS1-43]MDL4818580.1 NAD(P)H-dependent oxidoreductase [Actinomadura sp. OS1-43]
MSTTTRPLLQIHIGSTRPQRIGPAFAAWFAAMADKHAMFEVEVIDLAEVDLPFLDEPHHPRLRRYVHQHTLDWSATVERADAFVLVTPEYNYGYSAVMKNALDHLCHEWADKAVGFVSYGGIGAGTRAVQQLKQVVTTLRMVPVLESVNIPFAMKKLTAEHKFANDADADQAAMLMLDELARVTGKLRPAKR